MAELASLDEAVKRVVAPLLAATTGGRFPVAKPASPALVELTRLARAVHAVRGRKLSVALDVLGDALPLGVRLGATEQRLVAQLELDDLLRHGPTLSRSALDRVTKPRDVTAVYERVHERLLPTFSIADAVDVHSIPTDRALAAEIAALDKLYTTAPEAELRALMKRAPREVRAAIVAMQEMAEAAERPRPVTPPRKKR